MILILNEENSELRGRLFPIPEGIKKHLKKKLKEYEDKDGDKNNKGYDHLKWIVSQEKITTEELKRIKNFFDNFKGTDKSDDYNLYGGKEMSDWVNITLKHATKTIKDDKKAKKDAGLSNTERKQHNKGARLKMGKLDIASKKAKELSTALNEQKRCVILSEKQYKKIFNIKIINN